MPCAFVPPGYRAVLIGQAQDIADLGTFSPLEENAEEGALVLIRLDFADPDELGNALRLIGGDKLTLVATGETAAIAGGAVTVDLTVWGLRGKRLVE